MAFNHWHIARIFQYVQIINVNKNHWIAIGCQKACIKIFDCNGGKELPKSTLMLTDKCPTSNTRKPIFCWVCRCSKFQMQEGSHVCGLFAPACITSIRIMDKIQRFYYANRMQWRSILLRTEWWLPFQLLQASRLPKASIRKNIPVYCMYLPAYSWWLKNDTMWYLPSVFPCSLHEDRQKCTRKSHADQCGTALRAVQYKLIINLSLFVTVRGAVPHWPAIFVYIFFDLLHAWKHWRQLNITLYHFWASWADLRILAESRVPKSPLVYRLYNTPKFITWLHNTCTPLSYMLADSVPRTRTTLHRCMM